jgi:hypothetical protein
MHRENKQGALRFAGNEEQRRRSNARRVCVSSYSFARPPAELVVDPALAKNLRWLSRRILIFFEAVKFVAGPILGRCRSCVELGHG